MFDRNKFLALIPTGDHNLDEAVSTSVQLIEATHRNQAPSNLVMKLGFQANVIQSKLSRLDLDQQEIMQQLLGVIQRVKQAHERTPFITGRGMSPLEDGDLVD